LINSSTLTSSALDIFLSVSSVGFWFFPASILKISLYQNRTLGARKSAAVSKTSILIAMTNLIFHVPGQIRNK